MFTLYDNIVRICDEHGVKPSRMCIEAGVSKSIMSRLKKDKDSSITTEVAQKIADFFGISVGEVLNGKTSVMSYGNTPLIEAKKTATDYDDGLDDEERVLIRLFRSLPAEHRAAIIRRLQELERLQRAQDDLLQF